MGTTKRAIEGMAIQQSMPFLLLLLVVISAGGADAAAGGPSPVIASTCTTIAASRPKFPAAHEYCVRTLSGDPATAAATDPRGLAVAAASLTVANVTHTERVIEQIIGNLQKCLETYKGMRGAVAGGVEDLRAGRVDAAVANLSKAPGLPLVCLLSFADMGKDSPVGDELEADTNLADLASSVAKLLKPARKA